MQKTTNAALRRIDSITPEQTARFAEWSRKWIDIGLSTEPADFDAAPRLRAAFSDNRFPTPQENL